MERYICIHGHFYQPPRENPWLEDIELEDSAYPYHDWNERINAECYSPNAASRILAEQKYIIDIVNNYQKISFNFGPTLLYWMQRHAPEEYAAVLEADKQSANRFSGHGSAIAQVYNHIIMPLANGRDKRTQVIWGLRDFKYRFGREPEGMWLPETAVNIESLEILAEHGIKFTILVPRQAHKVRKIGDRGWHEVKDGAIDTKRPYVCPLPSGKKIAIFFSDGSLSPSVMTGQLLKSGEEFANSMVKTFAAEDSHPQIAHVATDGETFGHHHHNGDMALAYCLYYIESKNLAHITNYAEFLEKHPPEYEVRIHENSSWSCHHGVERWKSDCGCNSGGHPGWNQKWRAPLREAMDFVRDSVSPIYEREMAKFVKDPWHVRDEYIDVILDREENKVNEFLAKHAQRQLADGEKTQMLKLLEMQRHCLLMYTSCGWFFDDIGGIEGVKVMQFAARAMQLAKETAGAELEDNYKNILAKAPANTGTDRNGVQAYEQLVQPSAIDLHRVGAHYAVSSLFGDCPKCSQVYCFYTTNEIFHRWEAGTMSLVAGRTKLRSNITLEEDTIDFSVLHLVEHNIYGGVSPRLDDAVFAKMLKEMKDAFLKSDIAAVMGIMNTYLGTHNYSLWHLFKDQQRKILNQLLAESTKEIEFAFRYIYQRYYPLAQAMRSLRMPLPRELLATAEIILNGDLTAELEKDEPDIHRLQKLIAEVRKEAIVLDKTKMRYVAAAKINSLMKRFADNPADIATLDKLAGVLAALKELPVELDMWKTQNTCFALWKNMYDRMNKNAQQGDERAARWVKAFNSLAEYLAVKVA